MRILRYQLCDVFTDRPLTGNALAVFTDGSGLDDATLQSLAREMNLSETTFVLRATSKEAHVRVRIFTPRVELPFAGHPILGTAVVLAAPLQRDTVRLETGRGIVTVRVEREGAKIISGWMTQPLPLLEPFPAPVELLAALGVERSGLPIELYDNGPRHVFVELASPEAVATLRPDLSRLAALGSLAVTTYARKGEHWKSRVFAPSEGIAEDPATGSAAGPLALHLARHDRIAFGDTIAIEQGAEIDRPSMLHARVVGSTAHIELIEVGGSAVVVARGEFHLP